MLPFPIGRADDLNWKNGVSFLRFLFDSAGTGSLVVDFLPSLSGLAHPLELGFDSWISTKIFHGWTRSGLNGVEPLTKGSYFWKRSKDSRLRKSPDRNWLVYPLPSRSENTSVDWLSCLLFVRLALRFLRHPHVAVFDSQNGRKSRERGIIPFRERVRKRRWDRESEKQGYLPEIARPSPYSRAAFVPLLTVEPLSSLSFANSLLLSTPLKFFDPLLAFQSSLSVSKFARLISLINC